MMLLGAVASAMVTIAGITLLVAYAAGVLPERRGATASDGRLTRAMSWLTHLERKTMLHIGVGVALGVVLMYLMRWPLLLIIVPAGVIGLPKLLSEPPQDQIKLLEALDRWVRGMLSILSTGKSITDALRHSVRQAPPLLAGELALLVRRLDDRWTPAQALLAMADALGSPDADAVLASLILSASRGFDPGSAPGATRG
jgi:tight adherence protein B